MICSDMDIIGYVSHLASSFHAKVFPFLVGVNIGFVLIAVVRDFVVHSVKESGAE